MIAAATVAVPPLGMGEFDSGGGGDVQAKGTKTSDPLAVRPPRRLHSRSRLLFLPNLLLLLLVQVANWTAH